MPLREWIAVSTSHSMLDRRVTSIGLRTPTVDVVPIQRSRHFTRDLSPVGRTDNLLGLFGLRISDPGGPVQQSVQRIASRGLRQILTVLGSIYLGYKHLFHLQSELLHNSDCRWKRGGERYIEFLRTRTTDLNEKDFFSFFQLTIRTRSTTHLFFS